MEIAHQVVVLDAADLGAESTFWARLLKGVVDVDDAWHMVYVDGVPRTGVQLDPGHVPPGWPEGNPQQIHLDLWVADRAAAHEEVMAAGGVLLRPAEDPTAREVFQVYQRGRQHLP